MEGIRSFAALQLLQERYEKKCCKQIGRAVSLGVLPKSIDEEMQKRIQKYIRSAGSALISGMSLQIKVCEDQTSQCKFYLSLCSDGKVILSHVGEPLGEGTFGKVKAVSVLIDGRVEKMALKIAARKFTKCTSSEAERKMASAVSQIKRECRALTALHAEIVEAGLSPIGIQPAPFHLIKLINKDGTGSVGYLGHRFDSPGHKLPSDFTYVEDYCDACFQCASGLAIMHQLGFHHGDIKPDNILYEQNESRYRVCLADCGGLRKVGEKAKNFSFGVRTRKFQSEYDRTQMERLKNRYNEIKARGEDTSEVIQDARNLLNKADVYSLGMTFFFFFTERLPDTPELGVNPADFPLNVPVEVIEIIGRCFRPNGSYRPTAQEVLQIFSNWKEALDKRAAASSAVGLS
jgi:serine/threonine protein kinase